MTSFTLFRPYYYGQHKWDDYLLDIQRRLETGEKVQRKGLKNQEEALGLAGAHTEELRRQSEELRGISDALSDGLEAMRAEFEWGFTLLVDRTNKQNELLTRITGQLDAIQRTLQSPLMTQARELFRLGQERARKGLYDKALEAFLASEQKNEVDFPLQLQLGKLYLYGKSEDSTVLDLVHAEKHLRLAARYAQAEKETLKRWTMYCGEAHFHLAVAAYLIGEQKQQAGQLDNVHECLTRALVHTDKAVGYWPDFIESVYLRAKCQALLGQSQDATESLKGLFERDDRYYLKADTDKDFDAIRSDIETVALKHLTNIATVSPEFRESLCGKICLQAKRFIALGQSQEAAQILEILARRYGWHRVKTMMNTDFELIKPALSAMREEEEEFYSRFPWTRDS